MAMKAVSIAFKVNTVWENYHTGMLKIEVTDTRFIELVREVLRKKITWIT